MEKKERLYKVDILKDRGIGSYVESEAIYALDVPNACMKVAEDMERWGYHDDQYCILSVTPVKISMEVSNERS